MANLPLTEHEKQKKELLALSREELVVVVALLLSKNNATLVELDRLVSFARQRSSAFAELSDRSVAYLLKKLDRGGFVSQTYYGYKLDGEWQDVAVFAADGLGMERLDALVEAAQMIERKQSGSGGPHYRTSYEHLTQRAINAILLGDVSTFLRCYQQLTRTYEYSPYSQTAGRDRVEDILATVDWTFWKKRPAYFRWSTVGLSAANYEDWTADTPVLLERTLEPLLAEEDATAYLTESRTAALLGLHHFYDRKQLFAADPTLQGFMHWAAGEEEAARELFAQAPQTDPQDPATLVDIVRLILTGPRGTELVEATRRFQVSEQPVMVNAFYAFTLWQAGRVEEAEQMLEHQLDEDPEHPTEWLLLVAASAWMGVRLPGRVVDELHDLLEDGHFQGIPWLEAEIVAALAKLDPHREVAPGGERQPLPRALTAGRVVDLFGVRPAWEYALRQLRREGDTARAQVQGEDEQQYRTIWIVDFEEETIVCKEQKMGKKGWSKGRRLKWMELMAPRPESVLEPADHAAVAGIRARDGRRLSASMHYSEDSLSIDYGRVLYELADHPRVYLDDRRRIPIELLRGEPELLVSETENGILLRITPAIDQEGYICHKETPTRYRIYRLTEAQARMASALGHGVEVPAAERSAVEEVVEKLRPTVAVQSTFDLIDDNLETLAGSTRPCFHLLPLSEGYKIEGYAKPLPTEPFFFKPGEGLARSVIVLEDGRKVLTRDLEGEQAEANAAVMACPTLARHPHDALEWSVTDTLTALRILLELRELVAQDRILIEHPKGETLRIVGQVGSDGLAVRVGKQRDWFEVDGKLTVNEEKVLQLESLLEQLRENDNGFVRLGEGEFVAITDELRDRVLEMEGLLFRKGKKLQLPPLASGVFAELTEDLEEVEFDDAWRDSLERIRTAQTTKPRVPKNFRAELRDYQKEGYRWMMRLAHWGVGGCLADDMGLGKTVQALAVLTARAEAGAALVIAPASVTRNWLRETERFAPALQPALIATRTDAALIDQLGPGDVALVSYGLIPFIGEELSTREWASIVIDEAQAIKNAATKRAKIVHGLSAEFKLATTGTPIENHLGELWSLFRFLNPGLLGSKSAFNEKYNRPIARGGDEDRRTALKRLVKPFILRRRKDEVLTELPPKTEIVLEVNLSEEEKALYEAMRRQAVREIAAADEQQKRFTVLAQLTKLRQAACHPRLVRPNSRLGSAKLELVGETILEILEGGHKALVFSQFVKHLKIVENWVKGQGIPYQYLDGSTPGGQRERAVNAFQGGEGQLFLISLKAGGTGLNLTAADYVLHLDPWWNPAAEDQASDRAHRIGQQRPVTVYRFVSQGTIEEQIIALHAEKRDLADQILEGTGRAGRLEIGEVLEMLREG